MENEITFLCPNQIPAKLIRITNCKKPISISHYCTQEHAAFAALGGVILMTTFKFSNKKKFGNTEKAFLHCTHLAKIRNQYR